MAATASSQEEARTLIIGLSGPSSSGKTTLARLLRQVFNVRPDVLRFFIIHEDDFYKTDKDIPRKTFSSEQFGTRELDDWDCVESLDLPLLRRVLTYVKQHGQLPDDFASKEDKNTIGESGVSDEQVKQCQSEVGTWLESSKASNGPLTVCLLDGFLLFPDPKSSTDSQENELYDILEPLMSLKVFIPSTRQQTIDRRTKRTGYVTLEGFWEDPPGYVEDVVWPNYSRDHAWLFGQHGDQRLFEEAMREAVDAGKANRQTATTNRILVGPGSGEVHLKDILPWAVGSIENAIYARKQIR